MDNRLFLMSNDTAVELSEQFYAEEAHLQKIIEDNPHLLTRAWGDGDHRLFLIQREFTVAESDDSANSYSLDHLLVGDDGVPILVEVKRSSDTRIRREVVAQMLDYACRASSWNIDQLRDMFKKNNQKDESLLKEFDTDEFWDIVATNLKAEHIRLVFVADKIPDTLRILIEFMDRSMKDIEVYGVEIRPYQTSDTYLLSSSVIGNSLLESKKAISRSSQAWDAVSFHDFLSNIGLESVWSTVEELQRYAADLGLPCTYGHGKNPSLNIKSGRLNIFALSCWTKAKKDICTAEFCIRNLHSSLPEDWTEGRLRELLTSFPGGESAKKRNLVWDSPQFLYIELHALSNPDDLAAFKSALQELVHAISAV